MEDEKGLDLSLRLSLAGNSNAEKRHKMERTVVESQEFQSQCRARDRAARERSAHMSEPGRKIPAIVPGPNAVLFPVNYAPWQQVQYVPMASNVFGFQHCMMPCWPTAMSPAFYPEMNVGFQSFQPVAWHGLPMFPMPAANDARNSGPESISTELSRSRSPGSSSSGISDSRGDSLQGGMSNCSSERSSSSQVSSQFNNPQVQAGCSTLCNHNLLPSPTKLTTPVGSSAHKLVCNNTSHASLGSNPTVTTSPVPGKLESTPSVSKPVPMAAKKQPDKPSLPRIPRVSATGNGPDGKTINGLLYRYNETEVSIVCACHGISFSPVDFVRHAGGTETSHPLKQIVVIG